MLMRTARMYESAFTTVIILSGARVRGGRRYPHASLTTTDTPTLPSAGVETDCGSVDGGIVAGWVAEPPAPNALKGLHSLRGACV
jgi:hypothetical protein